MARRNGGVRGPLTVTLLVALGGVLVGCSSDRDESAAVSVPATLAGPAAITTPPGGPCITKTPGQPLTEAEAVVRFSTSGVCPSYVTVTAGTKVGWANDHTAPVQVVLSAAAAAATSTPGAPTTTGQSDVFGPNAAQGGAEVFTETVAPGATLTHRMDSAGTYYFRIDLIPTFLGTVEVK